MQYDKLLWRMAMWIRRPPSKKQLMMWGVILGFSLLLAGLEKYKRHWRTIDKTLCTFLTSKSLLNKYWDNFKKTCEDRHDPFEKNLNEIYNQEICISPLKSLSLHLTNVNSSYGLSPFIDYKKLWDESEV